MMISSRTVIVEANGEREVVMTRVFDVPRELVFEAWTTPDLLKRWLYGPKDSLAVCEMDLRVGGALRFVWREAGGNDMGMGGVFREIAPPERLVFTENWDEDWTGGEAVVTITFVEKAGRTTMTQTVLYSSRSARDAVLKTRMAEGVTLAYNRLAEMLATIAPRRGSRANA